MSLRRAARGIALACTAAAWVAVCVGACAGAPPAAAPSPPSATTASAPTATTPTPSDSTKSLYERLGGKPAIEAVVDSMLGFIAGDARIAHRFALTDLGALRTKLVDQVCQATGGPCVYQGLDMQTAHKHQRIQDADFDALVDDLKKSLDKHGVPAREQSELLGALGSMRGAIVEGP